MYFTQGLRFFRSVVSFHRLLNFGMRFLQIKMHSENWVVEET